MKQVDELIRGELAAIKSIDAIIPRVKDVKEVSELTKFKDDHTKAVDILKRFENAEFTGEVDSAGPWGTFASAFTGGASFFGDKAAINALKVGEQHGLNEYKEALKDRDIAPELKTVIESQLIPQQINHLSTIERYLH